MQGSRALAFTAAVAGFVGLALSLLGGGLGTVGLALAAMALLCLLALVWGGADPHPAAPPAEAWPEPAPAARLDFEHAEPDLAFHGGAGTQEWEPAEQPAAQAPATSRAPPAPPEPAAPAIDLDSPLQRALAGLPPKPPAPPRYSPRMPVLPEGEPEPDAPVRRARRLVPSGQTLGEKREAARRAKAAAEQMEFTVVPTKPAPVRPAVLPTPQVPVVTARVAGKGAPPPELARGKCSGCETLLWAPKVRPISLRCPQCDKITFLK